MFRFVVGDPTPADVLLPALGPTGIGSLGGLGELPRGISSLPCGVVGARAAGDATTKVSVRLPGFGRESLAGFFSGIAASPPIADALRGGDADRVRPDPVPSRDPGRRATRLDEGMRDMGDTIRLGLVGDAIARSRAPALRELAGRPTGLPVTHDRPSPREIGRDFEVVFEDARVAGCRGLDVIHPHKERVTPLLRVPALHVARLGAVNTVAFGPMGPEGHDIDWPRHLSRAAGRAPRGPCAGRARSPSARSRRVRAAPGGAGSGARRGADPRPCAPPSPACP